jgi:hypothetical protein
MATSVNGNGKMRLLLRISWVTFVSLVLCVGFVLTILFYPFVPITYSKVVLCQDEVIAGRFITYTAHFNKYTDRVGAMTRYLVSRNGEATITLTPYGLADAKIGDTVKTVTVQIPDQVKHGKYYIRWIVVYDYFGIRFVKVGAETPDFLVTK